MCDKQSEDRHDTNSLTVFRSTNNDSLQRTILSDTRKIPEQIIKFIVPNLSALSNIRISRLHRKSDCSPVISQKHSPFFQFKYGLTPSKQWQGLFRDFFFEYQQTAFSAARCRTKRSHSGEELASTQNTRVYACEISEHMTTRTLPILNAVQLDVIRAIVSKLYPAYAEENITTDDQTENISHSAYSRSFHVIRLHGAAGSGKTTILSQCKKLLNVDLLYVTSAHHLCNDVRKKYDIVTKSVCKLVMSIFGIDYVDYQIMCECFERLHHKFVDEMLVRDAIKVECQPNETKTHSKFYDAVKTYLDVKKKKRYLVFLDEYMQLSPTLVLVLIFVYKSLAITNNSHIVLVLAGDPNQIGPLNAANEYTIDLSSNINTQLFSFLDCQSINTYTLMTQQRIVDKKYQETVIAHILDVERQISLHGALREYFSDRCSSYIEYTYPMHLIDEFPPLPNHKLSACSVHEWFDSNDIINISKFIIFSFTNLELSFNNLSLAVHIYKQLCLYDVAIANKHVHFQILKVRTKKQPSGVWFFPCSSEKRISVLPLIRYFPYKLLNGTDAFPRSTIVYLLDWRCGDDEQYVQVYEPVNRAILELGVASFSSNLFRGTDAHLVGFPLQLHTGETFASAQGLTIQKDIYSNFSDATINEIYVVLSRVSNSSQCKGIHIPP